MKNLSISKNGSVLVIFGLALMINACEDTETTNPTGKIEGQAESLTSAESIKKHAKFFEGCYTVSPGEPAQIKISRQQQNLVMQMKEPKSANRIWDDPEPLQPMPLNKVSKYFSINAKNVEAMIGRPDRILVIAKVKQTYVNIDPTLDSDYLGYILQGSNTIFKVPCDNTPIAELEENTPLNKDGGGSISIKPAGNIADQ